MLLYFISGIDSILYVTIYIYTTYIRIFRKGLKFQTNYNVNSILSISIPGKITRTATWPSGRNWFQW